MSRYLLKVKFNLTVYLVVLFFGLFFSCNNTFASTNKKSICNTIQSCLQLAKRNNAEAAYNLYGFYFLGQDDAGNIVPTDKQKALFWLKESAKQNYAKAQLDLGILYNNGGMVNENKDNAFFWIKKAAESGLSIAQYILGDMYFKNTGTLQDYSKALYWYKKYAENNGDSFAEGKIGYMYEYGLGTPQDYRISYFWYKKAAGQGSSAAQATIGEMFFYGNGVRKNYIEAYAWLNIALANNLSDDFPAKTVESIDKLRFSVWYYLDEKQRKKATRLSEKYWQKYVLPYRK